MEYRIHLPDHDWVIAERHKLIPSVYAGIRIEQNAMGRPDGVSYSEPTYISLRSGKHSSSTANTHYCDFNYLLYLEQFNEPAKTEEGQVKPVVIFSVDGGPDEDPRYPKVIANGIKHFKELNLDAIYVMTNALGRSAYNRVERRMAPLSLPLSGLILPHDSFGNHLDKNGKAIDSELEIKNVGKAEEILANCRSSLIIDGEPVIAEYRPPLQNELDHHSIPMEHVSSEWYVQESQYFLQISKYDDLEYCAAARSNLRIILPTGFFAQPISLHCASTLTVPPPTELQESDYFMQLFLRMTLKVTIPCTHKCVPYDLFCPSLNDQLGGRICDICGKYFASKKAVTSHKKSVFYLL